MNRVRALYDAAREYLSLSVSARYLVATHFSLIGDRTLAYADGNEMDRVVFMGVVDKKILPEFTKLVKAYKESKDNES